jgi:hypothetical protein
MNPEDKLITKRRAAALEHTAGIKAAQVSQQELAAAHLLRTELPAAAEQAGADTTEVT